MQHRAEIPQDWTTAGTAITADQSGSSTFTLPSGGTAYYLVRLGFAARNQNSSSGCTVDVSHQLSFSTKAKEVVRRSDSLTPSGDTEVNYLALSGWLPAGGVVAMTGVFFLTSWITPLNYRICVRTAVDPADGPSRSIQVVRKASATTQTRTAAVASATRSAAQRLPESASGE